ncbi:MAG: hypothetical protein JNL79_17080 [Myxococcales bacterium]|nr:hypothetical protein [Myxococcales bacterium]
MRSIFLAVALAAAAGGCGGASSPAEAVDAGSETPIVGDPVDVPIDGVTPDQIATFNAGDALFDLPLREADGLGPLYTRTSCSACHDEGTRGPGLVQKMSVVEADGKTPAKDQSKLAFGHTVHPLVAGGGKTPIVAPTGDPTIKVSIRVGPPVLGRGYMEAVLDSEIRRLAAEQAARTDGIKGRVNLVAYQSEYNPAGKVHATRKGEKVLGRFGLKARIPFLDDFVADAAQGDMGITSPLRPNEFKNPDGLTDDAKPGVDIGLESLVLRADYIRLIAIPRRSGLTARGAELFASTKCGVCHASGLATRPDYPIALLAGIKADVYTDFLLHDMGDELADGLPAGEDGEATYRDWRTAPLIGLRFMKNYLHDSRAHSVEEAIAMHKGTGSEASGSVDLFQALSPTDRATLLAFVEAL